MPGLGVWPRLGFGLTDGLWLGAVFRCVIVFLLEAATGLDVTLGCSTTGDCFDAAMVLFSTAGVDGARNGVVRKASKSSSGSMVWTFNVLSLIGSFSNFQDTGRSD